MAGRGGGRINGSEDQRLRVSGIKAEPAAQEEMQARMRGDSSKKRAAPDERLLPQGPGRVSRGNQGAHVRRVSASFIAVFKAEESPFLRPISRRNRCSIIAPFPLAKRRARYSSCPAL